MKKDLKKRLLSLSMCAALIGSNVVSVCATKPDTVLNVQESIVESGDGISQESVPTQEVESNDSEEISEEGMQEFFAPQAEYAPDTPKTDTENTPRTYSNPDDMISYIPGESRSQGEQRALDSNHSLSGKIINGIKVTKDWLERNYSNTTNSRRYIIVHDTGNTSSSAWAKNNRDYFNSTGNNAKSSAHYIVDSKNGGTIIEALSNNVTGHHIGDGKNMSNVTNTNSIGIEMAVNSAGDLNVTIKHTQALVKELMNKYNIPASRVIMHNNATGKYCSAKMLDNPTLWRNMKSFVGGNSTDHRTTVNKNGKVSGVASGDSLNVRSGPGMNSGIVMTLKNNTEVQVLWQEPSGWYKIKSGSKEGFAYDGNITVTGGTVTPPPVQNNNPQTNSNVNFRKGPGTNYEVISTLSSGTTLSPIGYEGNWLKATANSKEGWLSRDYVKNVDYSKIPDLTKKGTTANAAVNVRSVAGDWNSSVLITVPKGNEVKVHGKSQKTGWLKIEYSGKIGWVDSSYIDNVPSNITIINDIVAPPPVEKITRTTEASNLRRSGSWSGEIIKVVSRGEQVKAIARTSDGWIKLTHGNDTGYIHENYLENVPTDLTVDVPAPVKKPSINGTNVNQRSDADWNASVVQIIHANTEIEILGKTSNGWAKIKHGGKEGFVSQDYIVNVDWNKIQEISRPVKDNASMTLACNIRETASWNAKQLGVVPNNARISVVGESGEWTKITYNSITGYVSTQYVAKDGSVAQKKLAVLNASVNARKEASWSAPQIGVIKQGVEVEVIEKGTEWTKIKWSGYNSNVYAPTSYLNFK